MDLSDGCLYCYTEQDLVVLAGDPGAVPDDLVRAVASEAVDHWSREQWQFLYQRLAPRLVSLVRTREIDPALTTRALGRSYSDLASWPDDQRRALEDALGAMLSEALEHWSSYELAKLLGGLACAYDDLRPWLARLDPDVSLAAQGGVVRLACYWAMDLLWGEENWFTWWFTDDQATPVREWTLGARATVEEFSAAHPECKTARDTLIALDLLERGAGSPWYYPGLSKGLKLVGVGSREW